MVWNYLNGVSKFDGTTWTTYTTADGLVDNNVTAIAIDAQGNKWFGTYNGVSKLLAETTTGVQTVNNENQLILYPNPVQNVFEYRFTRKNGNA